MRHIAGYMYVCELCKTYINFCTAWLLLKRKFSKIISFTFGNILSVMSCLPIGALFAEQGSLYLVHKPNFAKLIDIKTNTPTTHVVETDDHNYKIIGAVNINVPIHVQYPYQLSRGIFFEKNITMRIGKNMFDTSN